MSMLLPPMTQVEDKTRNRQLGPLEVNPKTGEPFLRLREHKNIILTPPRWNDANEIPLHMNDARIYDWLEAPPNPYTYGEHWRGIELKGGID